MKDGSERRAAYQQLGTEGGRQAETENRQNAAAIIRQRGKGGGRKGFGEGPPPPPHCSMRNIPISQWLHATAEKAATDNLLPLFPLTKDGNTGAGGIFCDADLMKS